MPPDAAAAFDVEHVDARRRSRVIASNLTVEEAVALAREEAQQRRLGRMFRAGSAELKNVIVITERPSDP
jgi:hypothetical protein